MSKPSSAWLDQEDSQFASGLGLLVGSYGVALSILSAEAITCLCSESSLALFLFLFPSSLGPYWDGPDAMLLH